MNKTIHEIFPDKRHTLILGDSTITVPKAIEENVLPLCDVALVDGGHTYPIARSDIAYFANHMTEDNLLLFDDHPTSWGTGFGQAWDERKYGPTLGLKTPINYEKVGVGHFYDVVYLQRGTFVFSFMYGLCNNCNGKNIKFLR